MALLVDDLLLGLASTSLGATASWLCSSHFRPKGSTPRGGEAQHAQEVLIRLQELTARAAFDFDQHGSQIEEINDKLTSADKRELTMILDLVAKLIRANHQMHASLVSTEDKFREQAQEIHVQAAETRTDILTLLANRRALDEDLARFVAAFRRYGRTFSLIMADVDRFKKFNHMHGHPTGDVVLQGVAKLLRRKMRKMDVVARYSGEEFAILLPVTSLNDACKVAVRACDTIEKCLFREGGQELRVTMSFGVAEVLDHEEEAMLLARANQALAAAKENGRNCAYGHDGKTVARVADNHRQRDESSRCSVVWHEALDRVVGKEKLVVPDSKGQPPGEPAPCEPEPNEKAVPPPDASVTEAGPDLPRDGEPEAVLDLPDRAIFCQQVRARTAEWKRGGPMFSVALLQVDQFPQAGKQSGQQLREAATRLATGFLTTTIRETDSVGCYGPGCFALLLPTAKLTDAIGVAERLREGFSQYHPSTQDKHFKLTFSVGVVQVMDKDDFNLLFQRAEAALDAANRGGGNRAYYHDGERCCSATWRFRKSPK